MPCVTRQESFYAWVDIQEFRGIPTADYRRGKSMHIYQKYIREGAVLQVWHSVFDDNGDGVLAWP